MFEKTSSFEFPPTSGDGAAQRPARCHGLVTLLRSSRQVSPGLTVLVLVNIAVLIGSVLARVLDGRTALGVSVWDKPIKFALSFLAFGPALLWLGSRFTMTRGVRRMLGVLGWSMVAEITLIVTQSIRGTFSHFNNTTDFNERVYQAMAGGVGLFAVAGVIVTFLLARRSLGDDALALATKIAVPMMTGGAVLAFFMTSPKPGQADNGGTIVGGHTVGAPDGGPGLAFLGWSTEHGDLRVAHFLGLHSLQFIPLVAWLVIRLGARGAARLDNSRQRRITAFAAFGYGGLVVTALVQALREQPVTRPDGLTAAMFAAIVVVPVLVAAAVMARSSGSRAEAPMPGQRR